jgi:hypothetical protein
LVTKTGFLIVIDEASGKILTLADAYYQAAKLE